MFDPITLDEFHRRTGLNPTFSSTADQIVSLRDINPEEISSVQIMPRAYLEKIIRNIVLEGNPTERPYAKCDIQLVRIDPHDLKLGQTFVERPKYQSLLERFGNLFGDSFCTSRGTAKCGPLIVFGKTREGVDAVAHYVPPIIESTNGTQFLLDGVHRNFLVMRVGTTIESIVIKNVETPLPCDVQSWDTVRAVDQKPPRSERFSGLRTEFFRNVKHAGIDG